MSMSDISEGESARHSRLFELIGGFAISSISGISDIIVCTGNAEHYDDRLVEADSAVPSGPVRLEFSQDNVSSILW
jgi:hypothetical protein